MTKDDIFSFWQYSATTKSTVILSDSRGTLFIKLTDFFIGKTAIRDHSMKSSDQSARTYKTEVVGQHKNSLGEDYVYLKRHGAICPRIKKKTGTH